MVARTTWEVMAPSVGSSRSSGPIMPVRCSGGFMGARRFIGRMLRGMGIDRGRTARRHRESPLVDLDEQRFESQRAASQYADAFPMGRSYRIYGERTGSSGTASGHYFHQDLLVAREIHSRNPHRHIDVGSRVDGFVAHVASFRTIEVLDIRPLPPVQGIVFRRADLMQLPADLVGAADSVSCLHALEHFGLGRYGDPVEFDGWLHGLRSLTRMLQPGGMLYLGLPTGAEQRVEFNAHRVFSLPFLRDVLSNDFVVERCAFVHDDGHLTEQVDLRSTDAERGFGAHCGCSIWVLRRKA